MSIGALLLQPQTLNRFASFDYNLSLGDDVVAVARELATHAEWTQQLIEHLQNGLTSLGDDIVAQLQTRMDVGTAALRHYGRLSIPLLQKSNNSLVRSPRLKPSVMCSNCFCFGSTRRLL